MAYTWTLNNPISTSTTSSLPLPGPVSAFSWIDSSANINLVLCANTFTLGAAPALATTTTNVSPSASGPATWASLWTPVALNGQFTGDVQTAPVIIGPSYPAYQTQKTMSLFFLDSAQTVHELQAPFVVTSPLTAPLNVTSTVNWGGPAVFPMSAAYFGTSAGAACELVLARGTKGTYWSSGGNQWNAIQAPATPGLYFNSAPAVVFVYNNIWGTGCQAFWVGSDGYVYMTFLTCPSGSSKLSPWSTLAQVGNPGSTPPAQQVPFVSVAATSPWGDSVMLVALGLDGNLYALGFALTNSNAWDSAWQAVTVQSGPASAGSTPALSSVLTTVPGTTSTFLPLLPPTVVAGTPPTQSMRIDLFWQGNSPAGVANINWATTTVSLLTG